VYVCYYFPYESVNKTKGNKKKNKLKS